jgi:predicted DNA-binding transcriptional regulator YafY
MSAASRSARLRRALRLIRELCRHRQGVSIYDLARSEELSVKTIRRDMRMLQEEGIPIEETLGDRGMRLLRISAPLTELTFEYDELLSLYLGRRLLEPFAGTPLFEGIHSLFQKLEHRLFRESRSVLQELSDGFHQTKIGISDYSDRGQLITTVLEAVRNRIVLRLLYQKNAAPHPSAYLLHPYSLVHHHGALYLIAFEPAANFDPEEYLEQGFGIFSPSGRTCRVRIHFAAQVAATVAESRWHRSQEIEKHPDGSLTLELKLRNLEEVKTWVQSFGPLAKVLEPEELVDAIIRDLAAALQAYTRNTEHPGSVNG